MTELGPDPQQLYSNKKVCLSVCLSILRIYCIYSQYVKLNSCKLCTCMHIIFCTYKTTVMIFESTEVEWNAYDPSMNLALLFHVLSVVILIWNALPVWEMKPVAVICCTSPVCSTGPLSETPQEVVSQHGAICRARHFWDEMRFFF